MGFFDQFKESEDDKKERKEEELRERKSLFESLIMIGACVVWGVLLLFAGFGEFKLQNIIFTLVGIVLLVVAGVMYIRRRNTLEKWARYDALINPQYGSILLDNLSRQTGISKDEVIADLQKMMNAGYYPGAFFDYANGKFILDASNPNVEETFTEEKHYEEPKTNDIQNEISRAINSTSDDEIKTKLNVISDLYSRVVHMKSENTGDIISTVEIFENLYINII